MPLDVLWLIKGLGPGGSERLLVAAAAAHDRSNVTLSCAYVVAIKDHLVGELEGLGVRCECLAPRSGSLWPLALRRVMVDSAVDIVHVHAPLPAIVARVMVRTIPRPRRPAIVTTEHNAVSTYRLSVRAANRFTSRWDDATICVSDEALRSLRGASRRRAVTLRHGIDVADVASRASRRAAIRAELGVGDHVVIGTVANFREQKDYPNLLAAIDLVCQRGVAVRVVAVGQGPQEQQTRDLSHHLGLDEIVMFTGHRSDATDVMAAFDIFVLASRWEGLPVAVMEASALGLPIVGTAVGGMAEVLTDGTNAILVPPSDPAALADALAGLVAAPDDRTRLGGAARRLSSTFDVHRSVAAIEDIYRSIRTTHEAVVSIADPAPRRPTNRRPAGEFEIRMATAADREAIVGMMRGPLQWGDDERNVAFVAWKHDQSPFGPSPMWIALDGERVVAVRTFMRWQFARGTTTVHAARAVDTATDPAFEGRGLFRSLTTTGVDELRSQGYSMIFNTPNTLSRPGYLSMGWRDVGRVPAVVIPRWNHALTTLRARTPADRWSADLQVGLPVSTWLNTGGYDRWTESPESPEAPNAPSSTRSPNPAASPRSLRTVVTPDFLAWRYGSSLLPYRVVDGGDCAVIVRARTRGTARELVVAQQFGNLHHADQLARRTLPAADCDHALRLGPSRPAAGAFPLPGAGPTLTWKGLTDLGMPPLLNWHLALGDIELF